jgi:hypothetical protein
VDCDSAGVAARRADALRQTPDKQRRRQPVAPHGLSLTLADFDIDGKLDLHQEEDLG